MSNDAHDHPHGGSAPRDRGLRLRMASEARRVHSQHAKLTLMIDDLFRLFEERPGAPTREAFGHFSDALDAHMRVEETVYFPALHGLLPEVDSNLSKLITEHRGMREATAAIRARLEADDQAEAHRLFKDLADHQQEHEEIEEGLIERVRTAAEAGRSSSEKS